jgi:hypothetical protein
MWPPISVTGRCIAVLFMNDLKNLTNGVIGKLGKCNAVNLPNYFSWYTNIRRLYKTTKISNSTNTYYHIYI